jgi:hypothetical protein
VSPKKKRKKESYGFKDLYNYTTRSLTGHYGYVCLNVISATSQKCVTRFEANQHEFLHTGSVGPKQTKTKTCHVFVATFSQFGSLENRTLLNITLKTYHSSKHDKFQRAAQDVFRCLGSSSLEMYRPPKHVNFWELCFNIMRPFSMFLHVIPIHDPSMTL